jgi:acyl-CoA reductase-like NAD-dependent aldehyde dehydrogenase
MQSQESVIPADATATRNALYLGGEWVEPHGSAQIAVVNPATEETIAHVPCATEADVDAAVRAARAAFPEWSSLEVEERAQYVDRFADELEARAEVLAVAVTAEMGMPIAASRAGQAAGTVAVTRLTAQLAREFEYEEVMGPSLVVREAYGVVGCITPWNTPPFLIAIKIAPAIAAGSTVVLKPAETAPLDAFVIADAAHAARIPAGVVNVVSGFGPDAGEALVAHPEVDLVSFTGSTRAGRRVAELAAAGIKRATLELGGKSPNVILEDADLAQAVEVGVQQAFTNAGQICGAWTRMIVPRRRLGEVEELACAAASEVVLGDPTDESTTMGPIANARQYERVTGYIRAGIDEGARLVAGGAERPVGREVGYYVQPTLFSDVDNEMTIAQEEIFGPVLSIIPYDSEDEAVAIANDTVYGLDAAVFGEQERAERVARRIRSGRVDVNGAKFGFDAPFGGYKQSGYGRCLGRFGFEEFLQVKALQR